MAKLPTIKCHQIISTINNIKHDFSGSPMLTLFNSHRKLNFISFSKECDVRQYLIIHKLTGDILSSQYLISNSKLNLLSFYNYSQSFILKHSSPTTIWNILINYCRLSTLLMRLIANY